MRVSLRKEQTIFLWPLVDGLLTWGNRFGRCRKEALASASWTKKQGRGTESDHDPVGQTSTAATGTAADAVRDSDEYLDDAGDPDDVDTAPVLE